MVLRPPPQALYAAHCSTHKGNGMNNDARQLITAFSLGGTYMATGGLRKVGAHPGGEVGKATPIPSGVSTSIMACIGCGNP